MTKQEYIDKLSSKGRTDIVLIGEYINIKTNTLFQCANEDCKYEWYTTPASILHDNAKCPKCHKRKNIKKTHEEFMEDFKKYGNPSIEILGKYTIMANKIKVRCKEHGHEFEMYAGNLLKGYRCPYCAHKKLLPNFNSVAVLRPDLVQYFANESDAYNIMPGSHTIVKLKCPDCGAVKTMTMYNLSLVGFSCLECSANISYPNRLIRSVINQFKTEIDYLEYEWSAKWTQRQRYDVYFEKDNKKYTIEMQGSQHFSNGWGDKRSLEEIQEKDVQKQEMAINHGIIPIVIDSRQSDFDFIFDNIKKSILNEIFILNKVDINKCQNDITSNVVKQVCERFNNVPNIMIKDLANEFCVSKATIAKYLKMGVKIGWCHYVPGDLSKSKVKMFDADKNFIKQYESMAECACDLFEKYNIKIYSSNISRACQKGYICKGFYFEYV